MVSLVVVLLLIGDYECVRRIKFSTVIGWQFQLIPVSMLDELVMSGLKLFRR